MMPILRTMIAATTLVAGTAMADETENRIKEIRGQYTAIESSKSKTEIIPFEAKDDPLSGSLTRFLKDDKLVKAVLSYTAGDHGGSDERYYFHDGKLIFIHVTDSSWQFGGKKQPNGEPGTIDTVTEHRIYLHDGKIIRNLTKQATAESAEDLTKKLEKAANKPSDDKERENELISHAAKVMEAKDAAGVLKMLER